MKYILRTPSKSNRYDYLIVAIIGLLAFGNIGGGLTPLRTVAIPVFLISLAYAFKPNSTRLLADLHFFLTLFSLLVLISLLWTLDFGQAVKEIAYFFIHSCVVLSIVYFSGVAKSPLGSICRGWSLAVAITVPVALAEIVFDWHLPMSLHGTDTVINYGDGQFGQKVFASVTFGNWNGYVSFLCFALPFVIGDVWQARSRLTRQLLLLLIIFMGVAVLVNASRGGVAALLVILLISAFKYFRSNARGKFSCSIVFLAIVFVGGWFGYDFLSFQLLSRLDSISFVEDRYREALFFNGIKLLVQSNFLGVGVGSLVASYEKIGAEFLLPHNLFLELLIQYGVLLFVCFAYLLLRIYWVARRSENQVARLVVFSSLISLPVVGIINSGYWLGSVIWCYLASIVAIALQPKFRNSRLANV